MLLGFTTFLEIGDSLSLLATAVDLWFWDNDTTASIRDLDKLNMIGDLM